VEDPSAGDGGVDVEPDMQAAEITARETTTMW
jgi:hypothetical protein